jgi:hypothetical protein
MWFAAAYALANFLHDRAVKNFLNGVVVEIAQHVGITCTTGFDIATRIDMQTTPGCCAKEIVHAVIIGV